MKLRRVPGCPLVFVSRTVLVMEQPSGKSKAEFEKAEASWAVTLCGDNKTRSESACFLCVPGDGCISIVAAVHPGCLPFSV